VTTHVEGGMSIGFCGCLIVGMLTSTGRLCNLPWYLADGNDGLIEQLGKILLFLKRNRLVDDSGGVEKYKQIEQLSWLGRTKAREAD